MNFDFDVITTIIAMHSDDSLCNLLGDFREYSVIANLLL